MTIATKLHIIAIKSTKRKGKEEKTMSKALTEKDIQDGKRISETFALLSEDAKNMVIVYLHALRDKELADSSKKLSTAVGEE